MADCLRLYIRPLSILSIAAILTIVGALAGCGVSQDQGKDLRVAFQEQPWEGSGREIVTRHYQIFTTCMNRQLMSAVPGFMEAAFDNYLGLTGLGDEPMPAMPIYLMADRNQWAALTTSVVGPEAPLYLSIQAGGYCYKKVCIFWDIGGLGTLSVASHEGLHQFLAHRMKNQLPMWLEEGLCTQAEGYQLFGNRVIFTPSDNMIRHGDLRSAIMSDRWIAIQKLLPMDAGDAVVGKTESAVGYYGQLWSLVLFIRSDQTYRQGLMRLLADAQAGKLNQAVNAPAEAMADLQRQGRVYNRVLSERLFRHYICDDMDRFEREYRAFAERLIQRQGQ
jgi:hypothetical protein